MSHRLQVLIPETLDARVGTAAQRRRMSKGEWVRLALERALDGERASADPLAKLSNLRAPTGSIERMLTEIEAGRSK